MKWQFVVRYEKEGRIKDRYFGDIGSAAEFHDKNKRYKTKSILMRCRHKTWFELAVETEIYGVPVWVIVCSVSALSMMISLTRMGVLP